MKWNDQMRDQAGTLYAQRMNQLGEEEFYGQFEEIKVFVHEAIEKSKRSGGELSLRYPEESTSRDNPLRIGTKRIKINGIEFPFVAVSDSWVPALLHENRLVWIRHYRAIEGLRSRTFKVYYATGKVPYNRLPWTIDNQCDSQEYGTLIEAVNAALLIAHEKEVESQRSNAASLLGRQGGLAKSVVKSRKSKENGIKGGRKRSFSALDMESEEENTK